MSASRTPELRLDFTTISSEIRSLVTRRRELMMFVGSLFAAMGLFLQKVLDGELPESLRTLQQSAFFTYALFILVPTLIIALRIAKLHAGMVINGVFYRRALGSLTGTDDLAGQVRAARLNFMGMSAAMFWLVSFLAACATALLALSLHVAAPQAVGIGVLAWGAMGVVFGAFHARAGRFAMAAAARCQVEPFSAEENEVHLVESRGDSNRDLISVVGFAGLMLFSTLECITGLGRIDATQADIAPVDVQRFGPTIFNLVLLVTCVGCLVIYLRQATAIADFSVQLDPTDRPYQSFKLTDTLLGYLLLVFFFGVATHLAAFGHVSSSSRLLQIDAAAGIATLALYPLWMKWAAWKQTSKKTAA